MNVTARRPYRMTARASAAQATADRVLDATIEAFWQRPSAEVSLEAVARRAGVTKQTVLRRFGSKPALLAAAAERELERVRDERGHVAAGDVAGAVGVLVRHYERVGDGVARLLAEEPRNPPLAALAGRGREYHARWCEEAFAPALERLDGAARRRRLAQLVAVTDVSTWKLLRRDRGLSRREAEVALRELVEPLAGGRG
jgi:AcrR family transcriptional regulator